MKKEVFQCMLREFLEKPGAIHKISCGAGGVVSVCSSTYRDAMLENLPQSKAVRKWVEKEAFRQEVIAEMVERRGFEKTECLVEYSRDEKKEDLEND